MSGLGIDWPATVWSSPLLRGLDARGRRDVEAAGTLLERAAGQALFAEGEPADTVLVVLRGEVALATFARGRTLERATRQALAGDTIGEEALLGPHAVRDGDATAVNAVVAAAVPFVVLERALGRAGGAELTERTARAVRRRLLERRLRGSGLLAALDQGGVGALLDMATHRDVARGEVLFGAGEAVDSAVLVLDGLLSTHERDDAGRLAPVGYLGRGDLLYEPDDRPLSVTVAAAGPSALAVFPLAALRRVFAGAEAPLEHARRGALPVRTAPQANTTAHVVRDLYRVQIARSLLVIDPDSCVRCGHCVWSCGNAHDDGVPRLTRRGDKLIVPTTTGATPLLLPNSCQHCKNPACLKDCPTGAIVRDGRGEVRIRAELCTGCGNCARGCPWENIQIVPRAPTAGAPAQFGDVAVKCDLCEGTKHGPACVASCPTEAIVRIDPLAAGVTTSVQAPLVPRARPAWPWVVLAVALGAALLRAPMSPRWSGALALASTALGLVYVAAKRARPARSSAVGRATGVSASRVRPHYVAHLALGAGSACAVLAHVHALPGPWGAGAAALLLYVVGALTGVLAALAYVVLPSRLTRLEREGTLPEDLAPARAANDRSTFRALSGKTDLVKRLYDKLLAPYRSRALGGVALVLSGRSLGGEERRVRGRIDTLLEGRGGDKLQGIDDLVKLTVAARALGARAWLGAPLRGMVPVHVAALASFLVAALAHAVVAWSRGL